MSKTKPSIQTKRLLLRPFNMDDAPAIQMLAGHKDVSETTQYIPYPYPDGYAEAFIASLDIPFEKGIQILFGIELRETKALIGSIGVDIFKEHNNASMGYWIGRDYWNQGYATEASKGLISFCFKVLNLHRIQAKHLVRNPSSGRVMQKIGMTYEGRERESTKIRGVFETLDNYAILKSDFLKIQASQ